MNPTILTSALPATFSLPLFSQNLHSAYSRRRLYASSDRYDLQRTSPQRSSREQLSSLQLESALEQDLNNSEERFLQRRDLVIGLFALAAFVVVYHPMNAYALGFKKNLNKRRTIDESLYTPLENGLKVYDLEEGTGEEVAAGTRIEVHYDCKFRGIDVVSSRSARLLGGNRIIAEPLDFIAGEPIVVSSAKVGDRGGGGLFAGGTGPKPPPALSTAVVGMKKGGKRSVIVPPELGYGSKGMEEIPPNTPFELQIEILQIK